MLFWLQLMLRHYILASSRCWILKDLREVLDKREQKKIPTEELVQMTEFILKNNFFEFNGQIKQQFSGTAIGTKCAPTYACIYG